MDLDILKYKKVEELKNFLRLRGLKLSGRKEELVCSVFSAAQNNVAIIKSAAEVEKELETDYANKLIIGNKRLSDPFKLKLGWKYQEDGIAFRPTIPTFYVISFLMIDSKVRDLSDYKGSKAYSYFK